MSEELKKAIRSIPDFPKKGILFRDITTLLKDGKLLRKAVECLADRYRQKKIDLVVGMESRGFILGAAVACELGAGFVPIRKKGKLPARCIQATYELEYGTDTIEMHEDAIKKGQNILILDDLLATGGTASAAAELVEKLGGKIAEIAFLIELEALAGRKKLKNYPVFSVITY